MTVSYITTRIGNTTTVTVASTLAAPVYYFWYLDGQFLGMTLASVRSFALLAGEQARIDVLDSDDAAFDPYANAPAAYPPRKLLFWVRSLANDVDRYRIDQQQDGGEWTTVGQIAAASDPWSFRFLTQRLADLSIYTWRIVPVDQVGNDGTPLTIGPEKIVRTPDAPDFSASLDPDTTYLTIGAA
jgi:hypothetical protein